MTRASGGLATCTCSTVAGSCYIHGDGSTEGLFDNGCVVTESSIRGPHRGDGVIERLRDGRDYVIIVRLLCDDT